MAFPSPFKTFHNNTYAAIDPSQPSLSTKGKNIVITGGGSGIGPEIAKAFAKSNAASIALLGRTPKTLDNAKQEIEKEHPSTKVSTYVADITDFESLKTAFSSIADNVGKVDILVANAGYLPSLSSIADSSFDEWWQGFDINVRGNFNLIRAFVPHAVKNATVLNISTGVAHLQYFDKSSGYHLSKVAAAKLFDYVHGEYPDFFVLNIHPGVIRTAMNIKMEETGGPELPGDDISLPADFSVWTASPDAKFLNGKFVWANWDVDEMKAISSEIESSDKFTLGLIGWP